MAEVKESRYLLRHLELHLFQDCFAEKYAKNEAAITIAKVLKRAPDVDVDVSSVEVSSADLNADEIENDNRLIGLKEKEDTSRDCVDKNERLSHANGN